MAATAEKTFSTYYQTLDDGAKARYRPKLSMVGGIQDPYLLGKSDRSGMEWQYWPNVLYPDIYNYLIATPSPYTHQQLKANKSLEAYKFCLDGWVSNVNVLPVLSSRPRGGVCLVTVSVRHSQKLSAAPVEAWVAVERCGTVLCAHCMCMAGLGEACSHIAASLFTLDGNTQMKKNMTCTSLPCSWLPPSFHDVPYAPIAEIAFSAAKQKGNDSTESSADSSHIKEPSSTVFNTGHKTVTKLQPSSADLDSLFQKLSASGKPAILSLVPEYCQAYVPLCEQGVLPKPLPELFKEDYLQLSYPDLLAQCEECYNTLAITAEQAKNVEKNSRQQAGSRIWFQQRAGRVTASRFKAAAHTDIGQPSQSLIKSICYPENHQFKTQATAWGCEHEKTACKAYMAQEARKHTGLCVSQSGLVIHTLYPHMAASPDGIVKCECCGLGVLEIKCPFSCINKAFLEATGESSFCLEQVDGEFFLKRQHAYYYQIQAQMKFCSAVYGDFVV